MSFELLDWGEAWKEFLQISLHGKGFHVSEVGSTWMKSIAGLKDLELKIAEEKLEQHLQTKVMLVGDAKKGKIQIDYYTPDELERLLELIGVQL